MLVGCASPRNASPPQSEPPIDRQAQTEATRIVDAGMRVFRQPHEEAQPGNNPAVTTAFIEVNGSEITRSSRSPKECFYTLRGALAQVYVVEDSPIAPSGKANVSSSVAKIRDELARSAFNPGAACTESSRPPL